VSLLLAPPDPASDHAHRLPIVLTARIVLYSLCLVLTAAVPSTGGRFIGTLALLFVAVLASLPWPDRMAWWVPVAEGVVAAAIIAGTSPLNEALLPYLLVPALGAGLSRGLRAVMLTVAMMGLVLVAARGSDLRGANANRDLGVILQWLVVALAVGLMAAWAKRLLTPVNDPDLLAYEAAYRLLDQLRQVSRQLSVGLDAVTLAESLLDDLVVALPAERGAIYIVGEADRFNPLSARAMRPEIWVPRTADASAWARAWRTGKAQSSAGGLGTTAQDNVQGAVIPVRVANRTVALTGIERTGLPFSPEDLAISTAWAADYAIRLDTALLFSDVRLIATTEERRRLAREIHDGVAQELASLGYVIDDLAATPGSEPLLEGLLELRSETTRIITELRLSIFDLRSEVSAGASFNVALSEYVRMVMPGLGIEVHLSLNESSQRLRIETEAELLRIAQEALTNSRKHANAANIWISSRVDPPSFELVIEDDGTGLGQARQDSYGVEIMQERAGRMGADLTIGDRPGGGTRVSVSRA